MRLNPWETYSYHASKAAILYLTKRLAARLVQDHVIVTAIAPGAFQSDMNKAARDHGDAVAKSIPVKRIGVPEDMAGAATFLASKAGDYVVGDTITADGGLVHGDVRTSIDAARSSSPPTLFGVHDCAPGLDAGASTALRKGRAR